MSPKELFDANQQLVYSIFWKYFSHKIPTDWHEDAIQEGLLELWRICNDFDDSYGFAFSTYAYPCIKGKLERYFREKVLRIRIPRKMWNDGTASSVVVYSLDDTINEDETLTLGDATAGPDDDYPDLTSDTIDRFLETIVNDKHRAVMEEYLYGKVFFESPTQEFLKNKYGYAQSYIARIIQKYLSKFEEFLKP